MALAEGEHDPLAPPGDGDRPAVDTFWYDGGMKPETPEELYEDDEDLADEGMLFIGDKGKILCDFRANKPRLIPHEKPQGVRGLGRRTGHRHDDARRRMGERHPNKGTKSKGSFEQVAPLAEAVTLANIALRVPYKRLLWDAQKMEFTNSADANKYVRREQYRQGWEPLISWNGSSREL